MSGIYRSAVLAVAVLSCGTCSATWTSETYKPTTWRSDEMACGPAWEQGWRVYAGARSQHTYCGSCGPTVPMRLVHGGEER